MSVSTNDLKNGMTLDLEGTLFQVVEFQHVKPGKGGAFVRTKIRNVRTGAVVERTFNAGVKVGLAIGAAGVGVAAIAGIPTAFFQLHVRLELAALVDIVSAVATVGLLLAVTRLEGHQRGTGLPRRGLLRHDR